MAVRRYLETFGERCLRNAYEIIPIKPGTKRPPFDKWADIRSTKKLLNGWLENGQAAAGIGFLTRMTPLVDIDSHDPDIVKRMIRRAEQICGKTLIRVGLPPKTGLLYRVEGGEPFRKVQSAPYINPDDPKLENGKDKVHKLEILGDGQQFVGYAIHPDTNEPYRWSNKEGPHSFPREDLPTINAEQAEELVEYFEELVDEKGFVRKRGTALATRGKSAGIKTKEADPFAEDELPIRITTEELRGKLSVVNPDGYDEYFQVGMALHHQFDGGNEGLILWHEWAAQSDKYVELELDEKWPTFAIKGKGRQPTTARYIVALANEAAKDIAETQVADLREELESARSEKTWRAAAEKMRDIQFDTLTRDALQQVVKSSYKEITKNTLSPKALKELTAFRNPDVKAKPKWLEGYIYIARDEKFYNTKNRTSITAKAFDAEYGRFMLSTKERLEGKSKPEHTSSFAALNRWEIPTVHAPLYMPGEEKFFKYNAVRYVNSYSDAGVPDMPDKLTKRQRELIARVEAHAEHLFPVERDRKLLLSFMAYIVQTLGRVNWAPLLQGTEGDGKSFWQKLLSVVLGIENVLPLGGSALKGDFTKWAEGHLVVFIEEVRLHNEDRYKALEQLKPIITNDLVSIRAMRTDHYVVPNRSSVMLASNYKHALPVGDGDSRYFPIWSRFQHKSQLDKFNRKNPDYYKLLHEVLDDEGPAALLHWLSNYELHPEFDPKARAPKSAAREEMLQMSRTDTETVFEELLVASDDIEFCPLLLRTDKMESALENADVDAPMGKALKMFLDEAGFTYLGRFKAEDTMRTFYSRTPDAFQQPDGSTSTRKLKLYRRGKL